jgi:hypothetical protein
MTAALHDKMIAFKTQGGRLTSTIDYTKATGGKGKKRSRAADSGAPEAPAQMFAPTNKSPLSSIRPEKRRKQTHPGNNLHIPWRDLHLCEFCNNGVKSLTKHQNTSKKCSAQQSNPASARFLLCTVCSEFLNKPFGHILGQACPRALHAPQ